MTSNLFSGDDGCCVIVVFSVISEPDISLLVWSAKHGTFTCTSWKEKKLLLPIPNLEMSFSGVMFSLFHAK